MTTELDMVALSLLWTEGANRKPIRQSAPPDPEAPDIAGPDPRTLDGLDEVLGLLQVPKAGARAAELRRRAGAALEEARKRGIQVVTRDTPAYPGRLLSLPDPPPVLWTRGDAGPCRFEVAIVGSRFATPHGLQIGFRLGQGLAGAGFGVVSGLARGVDAAAHRGALRGGGRTIAVLGCGADVVYPPEHAQLSAEIAAGGALVSEFAPGVPPRGWHFPRRNRLISGLALGVVIVEAAERSGSLITARCALEQGRSVMAVPGAVLSGRNRGAHALIRDGARIVEEARDVVEQLLADWRDEFGPPPTGSDPDSTSREGPDTGPAWPHRDPVLRTMAPGETYGLQELADGTGIDPMTLMARLTRFEVSGWVRRVEGGRFVKAGSNVLC
ncbi:MAG: DNA-processing protein DprA [Vicinamibacterales bacterium]